MLHISSSFRYLLCSEPADMRKSFHGLAAMVTYCMGKEVLNGDVYIFISKRRNAIKLLSFDGDGFAMYYKRLEQGTFEIPVYDKCQGSLNITDAQLIMILKGIVLKTATYRKRYKVSYSLNSNPL